MHKLFLNIVVLAIIGSGLWVGNILTSGGAGRADAGVAAFLALILAIVAAVGVASLWVDYAEKLDSEALFCRLRRERGRIVKKG